MPGWEAAQGAAAGLTSAAMDDLLGGTQGDIAYRNATVWTVLATGTSGQHLQAGGAGGNPSWVTVTPVKAIGYWDALDGIATAANFATLNTRNLHRVLEYDPDTDESAVFDGVMPNSYSAGTINVTLVWTDDAPSSGNEGNVQWDVQWERLEAGGTDLDADSFAAVQSANGTGPAQGSSGQLIYTAIAFTQAQADAIAAGEAFRLKVTRDANASADTLAVDAQLLRIRFEEA